MGTLLVILFSSFWMRGGLPLTFCMLFFVFVFVSNIVIKIRTRHSNFFNYRKLKNERLQLEKEIIAGIKNKEDFDQICFKVRRIHFTIDKEKVPFLNEDKGNSLIAEECEEYYNTKIKGIYSFSQVRSYFDLKYYLRKNNPIYFKYLLNSLASDCEGYDKINGSVDVKYLPHYVSYDDGSTRLIKISDEPSVVSLSLGYLIVGDV